MPPVLRRWGRQGEQSEEVPDQVSTRCQNPVPEELDPVAGSTGGSVVDNRVEQLTAQIGEIHQEMGTLIRLLAEQRESSQDQAPPAPPQLQAPIEEQQPAQMGQYL